MGLTAPGAQATPQQLLFNKAYRDVKSHGELDSQFEKLRLAVTQHLGLLQRQAQVRIKNWLKKLSEETANVVWKRNRNGFAKLLLEQLRAGRLAEPFHAMPPDGPLPTLPKHAVYAFTPPAAAAAQRGSPAQQQESQRRLSASEALDEYLGRQDLRQQLQLGAAEAAAERQPLYAPAGAGGAGGAVRAAPAVDVLPGTRMQLVGAEARQVDRHQLADVGWQPSKLELEAQLGASRERERELQWRLQQAEAMLRQQGVLLQQTLRAPAQLGSSSPLSAIDDGAIDDERISPPRKRVGRRELQELIDKYEERRRQWSIPAWPRTAPSAGRIPSPLPDGEEEEILEHLDNFQRQTEAIRRHLARRGTGASASLDGGLSSFSGFAGGGASAGGPRDIGPPLTVQSSGLGFGAGGGAVPSSRSGLEPSFSMAGGPAQEPLAYPPSSPTVAYGVTPARGAFPPPALFATAARPRGGLGTGSPLFEGLPESPRLGAGRAAQRAQQQQQQQQASSASASGRGDRDNGAGPAPAPPSPRRTISPAIRHTLKSAAAAQKNSTQHAGPSPLQQQGEAAASARGSQPRGARSQGSAGPHGSDAGLPAQPRQAAESPASHQPESQQRLQPPPPPPYPQQQQQPGASTPGWGPDWWQRLQEEEQEGGGSGALEPEPEPGSNAHLASGAAELRRRLEQQLESAGQEGGSGGSDAWAAAAAAGPSQDPLASTSSSRGAAGGSRGYFASHSYRGRLPLEESSEEDLGLGHPDWRTPSAKYRLSDSSDGGLGGLASGLASSKPQQHRLWDPPLGDFGLSSELLGAQNRPGGLLADESSGGGRGGGGGLFGGDSSLDDFRRQTDAIKAQIAALKLMEESF